MSQPYILRALSRLQPADHLCWIYAGEDELRAALGACAQAAAQHSVALHLLTGPANLGEPSVTLPEGTIRRVEPGAEGIRQSALGYLGGLAPASPAPWVVAELSQAACEPAADFFAWLASLWAAAGPSPLIELYDARRVEPELLFEILCHHKLIVYQGELYLNEAAQPAPGDYWPMRDPRERIQCFIANLRGWSQMRGQLEQRLQELGAVQAIARAVNRSLSLEDVLQAALEQIVGLVRAGFGYIALWEQQGRRLLGFAVRGAPAQLAWQVESYIGSARPGAKTEAGQSRLLIDDVRSSLHRGLILPPLLAEGYTSFLLMTLYLRGDVQGTIVLAAHEAGHFGQEEALLLESLSEQVGLALDNARLYTAARKRAQEMSSLYDLSLGAASLDTGDVLRLIGVHIMRLFAAPCFFVALLDRERHELHMPYTMDRGRVLDHITIPFSDEGGLTGHVLRTGQPLLIADLQAEAGNLPVAPIHRGEPARSWLGVPLVIKGQAIGVMCVQSYAPAAFDEDDQRLLSLAAQQAASALENARLFQETLALERRYRTLLEELNDGYAVLQDGRLVFANARLGRMLGVPPEALLGRSLADLCTPEERSVEAPPLPVEGQEALHYRTLLVKGDGATLPVEVTLNRIEYEGRPAFAILYRDISSQVRLEVQLVQAEKLSAVGQLVSGVAHELNNPLTTIKGYAQLLQGEPLLPTMSQDLRRVEEAADRCRRIVRDLLTFARHYEPERSDTDVNDLLQRTVALRSYELHIHNVTVHWDLDPQLPVIEADPHRLQQVILNLIFNAEEALAGNKEGGLITIRSQTLPDGNGIRFALADNGPGIRPENLGRIFDPFFTTKDVGRGAGLGLSIAYGIVEEHGGHIWAESQLGAGAALFVELPFMAGQE